MNAQPDLILEESLTREDLTLLARAVYDIGRFPDAITILKQLIQMNPSLDRREWTLFGNVYKDAVDQIRASLRALTLASISERIAQRIDQGDHIQKYIDESTQELQRLCTEAANLIETVLLPAASDQVSRVFFQKLLGDMFRYMAEYILDSEPRDRASAAYTEAIRIADENLRDSDPFKLGAILNFAVFNHEQLGNPQVAIDLVKNALDRVQKDTSQLSEQSTRDSLSVVEVMQSNLSHWEDGEDLAEEEEEALE